MVARRLLEHREGEIAQGKIPGIHFDKVRFDDLAEDFFRDYRINQKKSLDRAKRSIKHLKEEFEGMRIIEITTPRIQAYIEKRLSWACKQCKEVFLADNVIDIHNPLCPFCNSDDILKRAANATVNLELAALKRMLNLGAKQTPPKVDRVPFIPSLKENNIRKGFFEHRDFIALKDASSDYLKGFLTFAYKIGWRLSEIENLAWNQVDLNQGIVNLNPGETKNDDGRTVYLDEKLKEIFSHQWNMRNKNGNLLPYVFLNKDGKDKIRDFRGSWDKACKKAGIERKIPHDFRRTAVRNMIRAGIPERVAMMISGHKTRSVFDRYNIVSKDDLKQAAQKQAEYLKSQKTTAKTTTILKLSQKKKLNIARQPLVSKSAGGGNRTPMTARVAGF